MPEIALVDDSRVYLLSWRTKLSRHATVHTFSSPAGFWAATREDATLLDRLRAVVTDYCFDNTADTGASFAVELRPRAPGILIILSSNGLFHPGEFLDFDAVIAKEAINWETLSALFGNKG